MLLYFNSKSWSKRYGPDFFTFDVLSYTVNHETEDHCCVPHKYATFEVKVSSGDSSWTVSRRAKDFYALWSEVRYALSDATIVPLPVPPPKTFGNNFSETFLEARRSLMSEFLEALLAQYNNAKGHPNARKKIEEFLEFPYDR